MEFVFHWNVHWNSLIFWFGSLVQLENNEENYKEKRRKFIWIWNAKHRPVIFHWTKACVSFAIFCCLRGLLFLFFFFFCSSLLSSERCHLRIFIEIAPKIIHFEIANSEHSWNEFFPRNIWNKIHLKEKNYNIIISIFVKI